jgi:hypothetical protein
MWKSGTRHALMARATYLARPIAMSRYGDAFTPKVYPNIFQSSQGPAMSDKPDDVEVAPDTIAANFKVMVDSSVLDQGTGREPPTGALLPDGSRCSDEPLVADIHRALMSTRAGNRRRGGAPCCSGDRSRDVVIGFEAWPGNADGAPSLASRINERRGSTALVAARLFRVLFALVCDGCF